MSHFGNAFGEEHRRDCDEASGTAEGDKANGRKDTVWLRIRVAPPALDDHVEIGRAHV